MYIEPSYVVFAGLAGYVDVGRGEGRPHPFPFSAKARVAGGEAYTAFCFREVEYSCGGPGTVSASAKCM